MSDVEIPSEEQIVMDNLDKLQNENESLKQQMQRLLMTLSTYQDENGKSEREKDEMMKQIKFFREKSEESFLKCKNLSKTLSNLKQDTIRLTEENDEYKTNLNELRQKTKIIQNENKLLRHQTMQYGDTLSESRLNENALTTQLLQLKTTLRESQAKYEAIHEENAKLKNEMRTTNCYTCSYDDGYMPTLLDSQPTSTRTLTYRFESTDIDFSLNHLHLNPASESPTHSIKIVDNVASEYHSDHEYYPKEAQMLIEDLTQENQRLNKRLQQLKVNQRNCKQRQKRYRNEKYWLHWLPCFTMYK